LWKWITPITIAKTSPPIRMKKTPATLFNDNERFFDFYKNKQNEYSQIGTKA
jgi:hypothetical protein